MVAREIRGSFRHFVFFLASIAIGVGGIVGVGTIAANFEAMTAHEARNLLAADLELRLNRPLSEEGEVFLNTLSDEGVSSVLLSELVGMMINLGSGRTQLVELKAVEADYPFYGRLVIEPPQDHPFRDKEGIFVEEGILIRLGLEVGEKVGLGDADFTILGIVRREPDKIAGPFSLGPRVLLSQEALTRSGLVKTGSRIRRRLLFRVAQGESPERLKTRLEDALRDESVRIKTYRETRPRLRIFLDNFTTYLGLVGLVTLMIGGIGVGGNVHAYLTERTETIAILKSLGCASSTILTIYLLLTLLLGGIGGLMGIGIGMGIYFSLGALLTGFLPPDFVFQMTLAPVFQGMTMGLITTLIFSIWPLRLVGEISPSRVFRHEFEGLDSNNKSLIKRGLLISGLILGWVGLAVWQAGSWRLGSTVTACLAVSILLLVLAGEGTLSLVKRMGLPRSLSFRYGIMNLYRPGQQGTAILLSLGLAVMILLTLLQVENILMAQLQQNIPEDAPGLFILDIQSDQKDPLKRLLGEWPLKKSPDLTPLIRSRLHAIDGNKVSEMDLEDRRDSWYFTREYVLTYQEDLPEHNIVQKGRWWEGAGKEGQLSVEVEAGQHLGIGLGSEVTFDIQGVQISGTVSSTRTVDWGSMTTNFYFIFPPEVLRGSPETFVATITASEEDDLSIQNAVIGRFPNITIIPIREILERIARILSEIARTVEFMAILGLTVGLVVVSGAIAATRGRRVHEMVLFKILGATRPNLMAMMAVEYAVFGLIAALVGGGLSLVFSWGIVHFFLEIPWKFEGLLLVVGGVTTIALTLLTGFLVTYRILGEKPLAALRAE